MNYKELFILLKINNNKFTFGIVFSINDIKPKKSPDDASVLNFER